MEQICGKHGDVIRVRETGELVYAELYPEATTTQQARHGVLDYAVEEVRCNDTALLQTNLYGELF